MVIGKHDFENLEEIYYAEPEPIRSVLNLIVKMLQLVPLTEKEIREILEKIRELQGKAYGWEAKIDTKDLMKDFENGGYLLWTRIQAAIELFD